ncbi:MAG: hypothetical protein RSH26_00015, partial [Clostridia bacterium]
MSGKNRPAGTKMLYAAIVLCLMVSAAAVYGLMNKVGTYQQSEEVYQNVQQAALHSAAEGTLTPEATSAQTVQPQELEGESGEDEEFLWMLANQSEEWVTPQAALVGVRASASANGATRFTPVEAAATPWAGERLRTTAQAPQTPAPTAQATVP